MSGSLLCLMQIQCFVVILYALFMTNGPSFSFARNVSGFSSIDDTLRFSLLILIFWFSGCLFTAGGCLLLLLVLLDELYRGLLMVQFCSTIFDIFVYSRQLLPPILR